MAVVGVLATLLCCVAVANAVCSSTAGMFHSASSCYFYNPVTNYTWVEARQYCVSLFGGDLVSMQTSNEQQFVATYSGVKAAVWIGLNDRSIEDNYTWTQAPILLGNSNWRPGEPNNVLDEDCVIMGTDGHWSDISCSQSYGFICERSASAPTPAPITVGQYNLTKTQDCGYWYKHSGYCYAYMNRWRTYYQARNDCFALGATLANVITVDERSFIEYMMKSLRMYNIRIGLNDLLSEGTYVWDDGTLHGTPLNTGLNIAKWGIGQPNDQYHLEDCVEIQRNTYTWNDNNCLYYRPYICKRQSKLGATNATKWTPIAAAPTKCPQNSLSFTHPINKAIYCYTVYGRYSTTQRLSWTAAQQACRRLGPNTDLISIHDHYELNATLQTIKTFRSSTTHFWLGLNDRSVEGGYIWSDGTPTEYINWDNHQPDNYRHREDCVELWNTVNGHWNDANCGGRKAYICKQTLLSPPTQAAAPNTANKYCPGAPWVAFGSYCYLVKASSGDALSHSAAVTKCNNMGANASLASIHNTAELGFIMAQFGNQNATGPVYIGFTDTKREGEFLWDDGSLVTYTNWHSGEPNNVNSEDCTELDYTAGWWNDVRCTSRRGYVCKMPKSSTTKPTSSSQCKTEKGYIGYNQMCYRASSKTANYQAAQAACAAVANVNGLPGSLATITSRYTQFLVTAAVYAQFPMPKGTYWIGLNDMKTEGVYQWTSGAPVTYSNWDSHQPDDWRHTEDCAGWRSFSNKWNDLTCTTSIYYICEVPDDTVTTAPVYPTASTGNPQGTCQPGTYKHNGFCYGFFGSLTSDVINYFPALMFPLKWTNAYATCASMGATLVTIHNNDTQTFLYNHIATGDASTWYSFWTGLNDRNGEGGYTWSDGSALGFTNWALGEPNDMNGAEDCVESVITQNWNGFLNKWNDQSCRSTRTYICEVPAGQTIIAPPQPSSPPTPAGFFQIGCPTGNGWITTDTSCYQLASLSQNITFSSARGMCRTTVAKAIQRDSHFSDLTIKGDLASIHSSLDIIALVKAIKAKTTPGASVNYFIGLTDADKEGNFKWSDGSSLDFTNWAENQPDNWRSGQDCTVIKQQYTYLWDDIGCAGQYGFICGFSRYQNGSSIVTTMNPIFNKVFCKPGWMKWRGKCYKAFTTVRMTFEDAQFNCSLGNGNLLVVNDVTEQNFVASKILKGGEYYWIGYNDKDTEGQYRWIDGSNNKFTRWGPGQPNNYNNEDCVALHSSDSMWYDRHCYEAHAFICEVPLLAVNYTTQPMPTTTPATTPVKMTTTPTTAPTTTPRQQPMTMSHSSPKTGTGAPSSSKAGTGAPSSSKAGPNVLPRHTQQHTGLSSGAAAGIAIGGLLGVIAVGLVVFLLIRRRRRANRSGTMSFSRLSTAKRSVNDDDDDDDELLAE